MGLEPKTFNINIRPETFAKRNKGLVTGFIWISIGDWDYPSISWDDFPVVILSWWLEEAFSILFGQRDRGICRFMDGPYWFNLLIPKDGTIMMRFYKSTSKGEQCLMETLCDANSVTNAMLSAAEITIDTCYKAEWITRDLDALVNSYQRLKQKME